MVGVSTRALPLLLLVAAFAAACGSTARRPAPPEWTANARQVVAQLRGDVSDLVGVDRIATARAALHDESQLFVLLVAFSDIAGCSHMRAAIGLPPPGREEAVRLLSRACVHLQRAATLFTRAVARNDPRSLIAASQAALRASGLLDRAALRLARAGANG